MCFQWLIQALLHVRCGYSTALGCSKPGKFALKIAFLMALLIKPIYGRGPLVTLLMRPIFRSVEKAINY